MIPSRENPNSESLRDNIEPVVFRALTRQSLVVRIGDSFWSIISTWSLIGDNNLPGCTGARKVGDNVEELAVCTL